MWLSAVRTVRSQQPTSSAPRAPVASSFPARRMSAAARAKLTVFGAANETVVRPRRDRGVTTAGVLCLSPGASFDRYLARAVVTILRRPAAREPCNPDGHSVPCLYLHQEPGLRPKIARRGLSPETAFGSSCIYTSRAQIHRHRSRPGGRRSGTHAVAQVLPAKWGRVRPMSSMSAKETWRSRASRPRRR